MFSTSVAFETTIALGMYYQTGGAPARCHIGWQKGAEHPCGKLISEETGKVEVRT